METKKELTKYEQSRKNTSITREDAEEILSFSKDRLYRIEKGDSAPHPDEVMEMAKAYSDHLLSNFYCTKECAIGQHFAPEALDLDLKSLVLHINDLEEKITCKKKRLKEIVDNQTIDETEINDFKEIVKDFKEMSRLLMSLSYWIEKEINEGRLKHEDFAE